MCHQPRILRTYRCQGQIDSYKRTVFCGRKRRWEIQYMAWKNTGQQGPAPEDPCPKPMQKVKVHDIHHGLCTRDCPLNGIPQCVISFDNDALALTHQYYDQRLYCGRGGVNAATEAGSPRNLWQTVTLRLEQHQD
jgi:hypothetical protein